MELFHVAADMPRCHAIVDTQEIEAAWLGSWLQKH